MANYKSSEIEQMSSGSISERSLLKALNLDPKKYRLKTSTFGDGVNNAKKKYKNVSLFQYSLEQYNSNTKKWEKVNWNKKWFDSKGLNAYAVYGANGICVVKPYSLAHDNGSQVDNSSPLGSFNSNGSGFDNSNIDYGSSIITNYTLPPHDWPDFNIKDFAIFDDENGKYTNEPIMWGIANHLQVNGGGGTLDGSQMYGGPNGEMFPPGKLPIPPGFFPDKAWFWYITHTEGTKGCVWTSGKDSKIPIMEAGCFGRDFPGGVHSSGYIKKLGLTLQDAESLGITDKGRAALEGERKHGVGWGWYTQNIPDNHPYWQKLMPYYRDSMIEAWNQPAIAAITDPVEKMTRCHYWNWYGSHYNAGLTKAIKPQRNTEATNALKMCGII